MKRLICFFLLIAVLTGIVIPAVYADSLDCIDALQPVLRLDAAGFVVNSEGTLLRWADRSGNGTSLAARPTAMTAPTYKADGLNGKPTLVFSHATTGIGLRVDSADLAQGKQYTAFAVYKTDLIAMGNDNKEQFVFRFGSKTHQFAMHLGLNKANSYVYSASTMAKNGTGWGNLPTSKAADTVFHIQAVTYDAAAGTVHAWVDGKSNAAAGSIYAYTGENSGNQLFLGTDQSKTKGLEGEIAAIVMFDRILTDRQIDMVAAQLADSYTLSWEALTAYTAPGKETAANRLLGVQGSAVTDGTYSVRFVASLDSLHYREVGFRITAMFDGKAVRYEIPCENVYDEILASDESGVSKKVTAKSLGAAYLAAATITGIPEAREIVFRVEPYYINTDGTEVLASVIDIRYSGGAFLCASAAE